RARPRGAAAARVRSERGRSPDRRTGRRPLKFWDSSALVPLLVAEAPTPRLQAVFEADPVVLAWWATEVECVSAIARLERDGNMSPRSVIRALARLDSLAASWHEIQPV